VNLGFSRIRALLAGSAAALALGALAPPAGAAGNAVYSMHRPGLRVRLEVRDRQIVSTRIWARERCSDGFEGSFGLFLHGPGQRIHISSSGRFSFKLLSGGGYWRRIHLGGRVHDRSIAGSYTVWERRSVSGPICGTGSPGSRTLRFTARR
jgi:hypothetical protein